MKRLLTFTWWLMVVLSGASQAVVLPPSDDTTTVTAGKTPSGAGETLFVGGKYRGWIRFDLDELPIGITSAQISRAILRLYPVSLSAASSFSLAQVSGPWSEETLTGANAPGNLPPAFVNVPVPATLRSSYLPLDITALVRFWLDQPSKITESSSREKPSAR